MGGMVESFKTQYRCLILMQTQRGNLADKLHSNAGRQAGRRAGGRAGRKAGRQAGSQSVEPTSNNAGRDDDLVINSRMTSELLEGAHGVRSQLDIACSLHELSTSSLHVMQAEQWEDEKEERRLKTMPRPFQTPHLKCQVGHCFFLLVTRNEVQLDDVRTNHVDLRRLCEILIILIITIIIISL